MVERKCCAFHMQNPREQQTISTGGTGGQNLVEKWTGSAEPAPYVRQQRLQEWIADTPLGSTPAPDVGSTPTPALINCIAVQPYETQQVSEQRPGLSSQAQSSMRIQPPHKAKGAKPSAGKSRGIPELPLNTPPLDSSIKAWREFIDKEQRCSHWGEDGKSTLVAMLPGGTLSRPDDSDTEANPLFLHKV
ncbi:hypothetical protein BKA82DRAFT_4358474 [Pisolithus tinctorius]|nr:hypothetical protein BKA82DRAFT_4358474 [Pisolithus tinctorius]